MPSTSALAVLLMAPITAGFTPTMGILGFPKKVLSKITGGSKQNFLEAKPYYDQSTIPVNTYKAKTPYVGKVVSVKRIVGPQATGETCDGMEGALSEQPDTSPSRHLSTTGLASSWTSRK